MMNNNNSDSLNVLPSTIAKSIIDLVLYRDWVSDDINRNRRSLLIENALNLSKVCKRWLKITSSVFVQYYSTLIVRSTSITYIKRLQQNIESPFCLLYHYPLPKVELVFGYDYEQISYNTMKQLVLLKIQSTQQNNQLLRLQHQQLYKQRNTEWSQFSNLKHQIEHQPTSTRLKPLQPKVIQYIYNEMRQPPPNVHFESVTQLEDRLRLLYSSNSDQNLLSIDQAIKENELKSSPNNISKQSAIFNQLVQLFTNRAVFGQITTLDIYTYDDIDVDVLIPIVQQGGNQLTTLFLDGRHNQKVCQAILPIAMNLTTLAYRDSLVYRDNAINNNNNPKKEYNNHNTLERLYLVTPDTNILINIFKISSGGSGGGGLIFNNLKYLQIPSSQQPFMPWNHFKVSLPLLEVLNMEGDFKNPCPALIDYLIARGGEVQYIAPIHLTLDTFPLIQYLPYYLDLTINMLSCTFPPIKYHPSLLGLNFCSIASKDELLKLDPFQNIPFTTLKSLKLEIRSLDAITPYLDRFKQLDTLVIFHRSFSDTVDESLYQNISQIQTLTHLDLRKMNSNNNNNNHHYDQQQLPYTITKFVIDLILYCDRDQYIDSQSLIENALNLSKVSKRWLKITSSVFVQYYSTFKLQFTLAQRHVDYIKRLQQNIESPFCLLHHYPLPKIELVFGYDYEQISINSKSFKSITRNTNNSTAPQHRLRLDVDPRTHHHQWSILKQQILKHPQTTTTTTIIPIQPQPPQQIVYSEQRQRELDYFKENTSTIDTSPNTIDKQSAIYNQLVQLFTNREVFGEITILDIYTYDDIDTDVLLPIVQHGNQLTTLFIDGLHNQQGFENNFNKNNNNNNNNNDKEEDELRLYLVTPDCTPDTNILNNIFKSSGGGGLIYNNLKFLQMQFSHQLFMDWDRFKVSLPNLEVIKMEGRFMSRDGKVQYMAPINYDMNTSPLIQYLPYYLELMINSNQLASENELLCQNISQIQSLTSLDMLIGDGQWNGNFKPMIKQLVNLKIFKTGTSNLNHSKWISTHFNIEMENYETTLTRK
ncbi:hypothetical protein DFA_06540 [Cavenderia fasciculata]|uniref:Uncharacterized protein n=1 Tax=Cavenderia fasciculata TaxID=261658 RepID=F4PJA4_CACFS|nr:uncharacterized protein DFA_06540 [Cavenderia fasciculata]EGG24390.1 hypothetical protein DFA_06540 [Cavenderia fasciculata]|eukprot:XP_004362241.1 hypothetical protein DFA_06540 [Cavenderia fasciculata]